MNQKMSQPEPAPPSRITAKKPDLHFADVIPRGLPRIKVHFSVGIRHFVKDYIVPLLVTGVTILLVLLALVTRISERSSLAGLLLGAPGSGQDYGTLLSRDKANAPVRQDEPEPTAPRPSAPPGTSSPLTASQGGATVPQIPGNQPASGGNSGSLPAPFTASITAFSQQPFVIDCGAKRNKASCSKRYSFSASVTAANGPGTVAYGWRSSLPGTNEDGSYNTGAGTSVTSLQKTVVLACVTSGTYTMQFVTTAPSAEYSGVIGFNHQCNDL